MRLKGYPQKIMHGHPHASTTGITFVHIAIASAALGRPLPKGAQVHHIDGNKQNNANSNLVICQDDAYHKLIEFRARVLAAGGNPNTDKVCCDCHEVKRLELFNVRRMHKSSGRQSVCRDCGRARDMARRRMLGKPIRNLSKVAL